MRWSASALRDRIRLGASRQDRHRLRHGARHGARRRLVQFGARLHVRRWAASSRCPATRTAARPASPRRIRRASARWWCRDKAQRVRNFHHATLHALAELVAAAGLESPTQIRPEHVSRRISAQDVRSYAELYPPLEANALLAGSGDPRIRARMEAGEPGQFRAVTVTRSDTFQDNSSSNSSYCEIRTGYIPPLRGCYVGNRNCNCARNVQSGPAVGLMTL